MRLYRTPAGVVLERDRAFALLNEPWDAVINRRDLHAWLSNTDVEAPARPNTPAEHDQYAPLAPIGTQEVWAAGVTYLRSRAARVEEARDAGGGSFYDRVYEAERPELFFKAAAWRVRGPDETIRIRSDARWSVPEPELAVYVNARAEIIGYTIGNDVSSRDIEGENPLYLPQAKIYDGSCALGPAVLVTDRLPGDTAITLRIERAGHVVFDESTSIARMRRTPPELVEFLYRETSFPTGCVLLTGTGIVPPDDFTLQHDDRVSIEIPPIGTLANVVDAARPDTSRSPLAAQHR